MMARRLLSCVRAAHIKPHVPWSGNYLRAPRLDLWRTSVDSDGQLRFEGVRAGPPSTPPSLPNWNGRPVFGGGKVALITSSGEVSRFPYPVPDGMDWTTDFVDCVTLPEAALTTRIFPLRDILLKSRFNLEARVFDWMGNELPSVDLSALDGFGFLNQPALTGDGSTLVLARPGRKKIGGVQLFTQMGRHMQDQIVFEDAPEEHVSPFAVLDGTTAAITYADLFNDPALRGEDIEGPPLYLDTMTIGTAWTVGSVTRRGYFNESEGGVGRQFVIAQFEHHRVRRSATKTFVRDTSNGPLYEIRAALSGCHGYALLEVSSGAPVVRRVLSRTRYQYPDGLFATYGAGETTTILTTNANAAEYQKAPIFDDNTVLPSSILTSSVKTRIYGSRVYLVADDKDIYRTGLDGGPLQKLSAQGEDVYDLPQDGRLIVGPRFSYIMVSQDDGATWAMVLASAPAEPDAPGNRIPGGTGGTLIPL